MSRSLICSRRITKVDSLCLTIRSFKKRWCHSVNGNYIENRKQQRTKLNAKKADLQLGYGYVSMLGSPEQEVKLEKNGRGSTQSQMWVPMPVFITISNGMSLSVSLCFSTLTIYVVVSPFWGEHSSKRTPTGPVSKCLWNSVAFTQANSSALKVFSLTVGRVMCGGLRNIDSLALCCTRLQAR